MGQKQAAAFRLNLDFYVMFEQKKRRIQGQREENDQLVLSRHTSGEKNNVHVPTGPNPKPPKILNPAPSWNKKIE